MTETSPASGAGRVITRFGADLLVENAAGEILRCTARRKLDHVACGDQVQWESQAQGNAAVTRILPRKNVLERLDFRSRPRAIAANIDLLVIVTSWQPAPVWEMLDRYLIAALRMAADAILLVNKSDLRATHARQDDESLLAEYQQIGYPILHASAETGEGLDDLQRILSGKTAIVSGQSGVGKSSLAAQLLPDADIRIGAIADTGEGRHTTTSATLYHLPEGGDLIDSPGVRDFGLPDLDAAAVLAGYPEFQPYRGECRFHNCTHRHEPGCAIKAAVKAGELPPRRHARYCQLLDSLGKPRY